jgi:hypothetical protein
MKSEKNIVQTDVSVNGNMDGNIIVGNGNQINLSAKISADKVASELAIQRLKEQGANLRENCWEFIIDNIVSQHSLLDSITGKYNPYGQWLYNTMLDIPNFKLQGEKVKISFDDRKVADTLWNMSSEEIQQVIDYLPSKWKGKNLDGLRKFGGTILDYAKKIEECRSEIKKHKIIIQA